MNNVSVKLDIKKAFGNLLKQFTKAFCYFIGAIQYNLLFRE